MSDEWRERAKDQQQNFAVSLGDRTWDRFNTEQESELTKKISFAFIGPPQSENTKEQEELVSEILKKCKECCNEKGSVVIAFLFVCAYKDASTEVTVPLIRVKKNDGKVSKLSHFVDHVGRVYEDWDEFLKDNIFSGWWICTPKDGEYLFSGQDVQVEFDDQSKRGNVVEVIDTVSTILGVETSIGMTAGLIMSFFPPTALLGACTMTACSIVGAPAAMYGAGRSVRKLVDRGTHKQSLNPFASSEARACWLSTTASVFSLGTMASGQILASTAKAGYLAGSGTRFFCTALNVSSLSVNGLGVVNSVYEVAKKGKDVTTLEVLQLSTSILFFTHSAMNFKTASSIIKDAQQSALVETRNSLRSQSSKEAFDHMLQSRKEMVEPGKVRTMHGNKEFIRDLKNINNPQEFFQHFRVVRGNQLSVNNELNISGKSFLQMTEVDRSTLIRESNDLKNNRITEQQFNARVSSVKQNYRIMFERERSMAIQRIEKAFEGSNIPQKMLSDLQLKDIQRMDNVLSDSGKKYNPECIKVACKMKDQMKCKDVSEFTAATEYAIRKLDAKVADLRAENPNPTGLPRRMKPKDFYFKQVTEQFLQNPDSIVQEFQKLMETCETHNSAGNTQFGNTMAAANHYDKHSFFPGVDPAVLPGVDLNNNLTPESYFAIAREMCSGPVENPKWVQDGSSLMCIFHSEKYGAIAVRYDNLADGRSVIATLMSADMTKTLGEPRHFTSNRG